MKLGNKLWCWLKMGRNILMVNSNLSLLVNRFGEIHRELLNNRTFEAYEIIVEQMDRLFEELQQQNFNEDDRDQLLQIKNMHDDIINIILLEKVNLVKDIAVFSKKKQVTSQYGKISDYDGSSAFFIDYKK